MVQAGLIPALKRRSEYEEGENNNHPGVLTTIFTPEVRPLERLSIALRQLQSQVDIPMPLEDTLHLFQTDEMGLHYKVTELCPDPKTQSLLLIIDQFEELFTQTLDDDERQQFIRLLLRAVEISHAPTRIVLTMRSDFLGKCAAYPDLNLFVSDHLFQIEPMTPENLRLAIEGPTRLAGLQLEEGLVSRILHDAGGASEKLPLVEHALLELYERREGSRITQRAEAEYHKLINRQQEILRKMFMLRLIQPGDGAEDTHRRATREELMATGGDSTLAEEVLRSWTEARLLTTTTDETKRRELINLAHETLIREWPRVQEWLKDERESARLLGQLRQAAAERRDHRQGKAYLYQGVRLLQAKGCCRNMTMTLPM